MNKEDFKEGSVERAIFGYWDSGGKRNLEGNLMRLKKQELVSFIVNCQGKGAFVGHAHPER